MCFLLLEMLSVEDPEVSLLLWSGHIRPFLSCVSWVSRVSYFIKDS